MENKEQVEWWENDYGVETCTTYVYKKYDTEWEQVDRYKGLVPDPHDVGLKLGGGQYKFIIHPKGKDENGDRYKAITKYETLAKYYDTERDKIASEISEVNSNSIEQNKKLAGSPSEWVDAIVGMVERLAPLALSMIPMGGKVDPYEDEIRKMRSATTDTLVETINMTKKTVSEIQKESVANFGEALTTLTGYAVNGALETGHYEEEEEEEMNVVKMAWGLIAPQIENIVTGLLDDKLEMIKSNPLFKQILDDPRALNQLQELILKHTDVNTLHKICQKLGIGGK